MKKLSEMILKIFKRNGIASNKTEDTSPLFKETKRLRFRYLLICLLTNILILASGFATKSPDQQAYKTRANHTILELPLKIHLPFTPGVKATLVDKNNTVIIEEAFLLEEKQLSANSFGDSPENLFAIEIPETDLPKLFKIQQGELTAYPFVENNRLHTPTASRRTSYEIVM